MPITTSLLSRYNYLISQQKDSLTKTRVRLLAGCLFAFTLLSITLTILYSFLEPNFLLIRAIACTALFGGGLVWLFATFAWRTIGHFFVVCIILLIWSNVLLIVPAVTMVTVQYSLLVLAAAYYILGNKWGLIYSLISILPLIGAVLVESYSEYNLSLLQLAINKQAYVITSCFNFTLLLVIHYRFLHAVKKANVKKKKLTANLKKALADAEELSVAKTNFLTTMSHELRTPLNAVVGMTNILLMEDPKPSQKVNLDILRFSSENLMATVNDILDFNQINSEAIVLEKKPFRPADLIKNVIGVFNAAANDKRLSLDCTTDADFNDLIVLGDATRLTQILFQLVGNAVKFTEKGFVRLSVTISSRREDNVDLQFCVADSGIGIPDELKTKIFEPFTTSLTRTSRQFHGTLGLTIAFYLVKLHNSLLRFESKEGVGTKFEFDLNYPVVTTGVVASPPKVISAIGGMRVLVVEDEKLNILVMKKILAQWDIRPDVVTDGQQAVSMVNQYDYDVILMDINMPVMDGFEASQLIKQLPLPNKASIPIIAVTASIGAATKQIDEFAYIDDCLLKPFKPEDLREKLMEIAGRKVLNTQK